MTDKISENNKKLNAWQIYKQKNGVTPLDLFNPNTKNASETLAKQRFDICKTCPEFISLTTQCKQCGCFMAVKTKLEEAKCPIEKW